MKRKPYKARYEGRKLTESAFMDFLLKHPIPISAITDDIESTWSAWREQMPGDLKKQLDAIQDQDTQSVDNMLERIQNYVEFVELQPKTLLPARQLQKGEQFVFLPGSSNIPSQLAIITDAGILKYINIKG